MYNLYDYELEKLQELMLEYGQKPFRAKQLFSWIYKKEVTNFDEMSDISLSFRETLKKDFEIKKPKIHTKQVSKDNTIKLLIELEDGNLVETVLIRYLYGNVACVSSEVGCDMKCAFCASGLFKKRRELKTSEILGQVLLLNDILKEEGNNEKITHIVVMGTGEPFLNYDNLMSFIRICNSPFALEIGARHISVSTCGIAKRIIDYANEGLQTNLAISLHAPNNEIRDKIMPINKFVNIEKLMDAVKYYLSKTNRRVTFEYILIKDLNDSLKCAEELVSLIKGVCGYVNLIPYNEVMENNFKKSPKENVEKFYNYLKKNGINVTVRKEFGDDIDAACGQLRAKEVKNSES